MRSDAVWTESVVKLSTDGRIVAGAADDPVRGTRARYMRANGRGYLLRFDGASATTLSLPALKRAVLQTLISLMQVSRAQTLREVERSGEACYEIDIPANGVAVEGIVALDRARAVVTAAESRLIEFSAAGRRRPGRECFGQSAVGCRHQGARGDSTRARRETLECR